MLTLFSFTLLAGSISALACPESYQKLEGRCIRPLYLWENDALRNLQPNATTECSKDGAHLPIIRNDEENESFNRIVNSFEEINGWNSFLALGLVCNGWSQRLEWSDGSSIDYTPYPGVNLSSACKDQTTAISRVRHDDWMKVSLDDERAYTVLCVIDGR